ncbi:TatD family hydrolase [Ferrimicrobium sp.]|uniref:TatD family hydrolase n=1 Tax=Ferrimicrobium sp. TaxID=2926050 RepID=UPI002636939B|nr:TatD family hydrolase [Ferrimicrobium sp.]
MWFDSHAHPTAEGWSRELEAMREQEVGGLVVVGTSVASSAAAVRLVQEVRQQNPELTVGVAVGIHPHDADSVTEESLGALEEMIKENPDIVCGVGECGLDLFYEYSNPEHQEEAFRAQIALAKRFDRTLVIHTRDAWEDTFRIFDDEGVPERLIMHCFVGGPDEARRSLDYNAYLSFSGIATFKNAEDVRQAYMVAPLERILVETDAPYLAPVPLRGRPNLIGNVAITGSFLAELRGIPSEDFARLTWQNTIDVFQLN